MEILPHFWISNTPKNNSYLQSKQIKNIIFLSNQDEFIKNYHHEQIRIPLKDLNDNIKQRNIIIYQHLYDVTHYIHEQITNNHNILLVGNEADEQILDIFIIAYFMRYGKTTLDYAVYFLFSKKKNCLQPKFYYKECLLKYEQELRKNKSNNDF